MKGQSLPISPSRRLVGDLMWASRNVPRVTVQRRMVLGTLLELRRDLPERPSWTALFTKGYALLSREVPELRRAYVKLPWPKFFEYSETVVSIALERLLGEETVVALCRIKRPEYLSIANIQAKIVEAKSTPFAEVKQFRNALLYAQMPWPLRRPLLWLGLNIARLRGDVFGTFAISVYSSLGAESLNPLTPLTTLLNYGEIEPNGAVTVRIHYDHRVMDGATVARALVRLEEIMNSVVGDELRLTGRAAAERQKNRPGEPAGQVRKDRHC